MKALRWAAVAALLAVVLSSAPAAADSQTFQDARGEAKASIDIHSVRVVNGQPGDRRIRFAVWQRRLLAGDHVDVWVDTRSAHPGPEYRVGGIANSDGFGIVRVRTWEGRRHVHVVKCPRLRLIGGQEDPGDLTRFVIPRRCLGSPGAIRVSVRTLRHTTSGNVHDWAPRRHRFYASVAALG